MNLENHLEIRDQFNFFFYSVPFNFRLLPYCSRPSSTILIGMMTVNLPACSPTSLELFQIYFYHDAGCGFLIESFYYVEVCFLFPLLFGLLAKRHVGFCKRLFLLLLYQFSDFCL